MEAFFKSVLEQDTAPVVLCDLQHTILYMNPAACKRYRDLTGKSLMACHNPASRQQIETVLAWFEKKMENNRVHTFFNEKENKDVYMVALRDQSGALIGYYEKHEFRSRDMAPLYQFED